MDCINCVFIGEFCEIYGVGRMECLKIIKNYLGEFIWKEIIEGFVFIW